MSEAALYRWHGGELQLLDHCDPGEESVEAADSWLVSSGRTLGLDLHRARFMTAIPRGRLRQLDPDAFWAAALAMVPDDGDWFPRVELQDRAGGLRVLYRHRTAPERTRSVAVATYRGGDPRRHPTTKGPDLGRMLAVRTSVQPLGAQEAIILNADGYLVEGAYSALLWWRGDILCGPPASFPRIDSVTARTVLTVATAIGVETYEEAITPAELEGTEVWALSALQGIRIVTDWIDGPATAELPGRLQQWRDRLDALRRPIRAAA